VAQRRAAHKLAHAQCPFGASNWSDCDALAAHRWGQCKAMVEDKAGPHPCTRWAQDEDGYCGQHFLAQHDAEVAQKRAEERQLQLAARIDAFLVKSADPNYKWWEALTPSAESTRGLPGPGSVGVVMEPVKARVRKLPHRLTEAEL
jgi:hypothetical protein